MLLSGPDLRTPGDFRIQPDRRAVAVPLAKVTMMVQSAVALAVVMLVVVRAVNVLG